MYTLMIVEDEEIERNSLHKLLSEMFTFDQVRCAKNGIEALHLYEEILPDIVLMDINLPGMNGLEVIRHLKQEDRACRFLILSSYDYFSYAQTAISLGVEDFILKPANKERLIESFTMVLDKMSVNKTRCDQMTTLVQKMKIMNPLLEKECMFAILTNQDEIELQRAFSLINYKAQSGLCVVCKDKEAREALHKARMDIEDIGYKCILGEIQNSFVLFIFYSQILKKQDIQAISNALHIFHTAPFFIGVGSIQNDITKLYKSYQHATMNMRKWEEPLLSYMDLEEQSQMYSVQELSSQILKKFEMFQDSSISELLHAFNIHLMTKNIEEINLQANVFLACFTEEICEQYPIDIELSEIKELSVSEQDKQQNLEVLLLLQVNTLLKLIRNFQYENSNILLKEAISYINQNYCKPISLNDIAKKMDVSSFYISKILNKYAGKNFTDLVNERRIEDAKKLLRNNERMKEVAFKVGFQNQSYFAKMFKKYVGLTPSEYQNISKG